MDIHIVLRVSMIIITTVLQKRNIKIVLHAAVSGGFLFRVARPLFFLRNGAYRLEIINASSKKKEEALIISNPFFRRRRL